MWLSLTLLSAPAIAEDCPASLSTLEEEVAAAEEAYRSLREDQLRWHHHEALRLLRCAAAPVREDLAARLHLIEILDAHLAGDPQRQELAVLGLLSTRPDYEPDSRLIPPGGSLERALELAREESWAAAVWRLPGEDVDWVINGHSSRELPMDRSSVLQRFERDAAAGWYLRGAPLPEEVLPDPGARLARSLTAAAAAAGVGSGLAWTVAAATALHPAQIKGDEPAVDASGIAGRIGVGLGAGALGLGAAAITARWAF